MELLDMHTWNMTKMATLNNMTRVNYHETDLLNFKINIEMDIIQNFQREG